MEHGAAWRWRPAQPLHLTAQPLVVFWSRSRSAPQPLVLAAEPLAFGLQPLLRLAQPGVLVLKPGQTPAQPARACRPRPVCIPLATIDTSPQSHNRHPQPQEPAISRRRSLPLALTAEIRLIPNRSPVLATIGVRPTGAQVVPAWSSERTPASSAK